jgi:hypothetical protein
MVPQVEGAGSEPMPSAPDPGPGPRWAVALSTGRPSEEREVMSPCVPVRRHRLVPCLHISIRRHAHVLE